MIGGCVRVRGKQTHGAFSCLNEKNGLHSKFDEIIQ
jgi:hypothetical protein